MDTSSHMLVVGAAGFIGAHLVNELLRAGHQVRVVVRSADQIAHLPWARRVEVVTGDLADEQVRRQSVAGITVAYYLAHSWERSRSTSRTEQSLAEKFAVTAHRHGVSRIVCLTPTPSRSPESSVVVHSRGKVGSIFLTGPVPAVVFSAPTIVDLSAPLVQFLTCRFHHVPGFMRPSWLRRPQRVLRLADVLYYLRCAGEYAHPLNRSFGLDGQDTLTYGDVIDAAATALANGLKPGRLLLQERLFSARARAMLSVLHRDVVAADSSAATVVFGEPAHAQEPLLRTLSGTNLNSPHASPERFRRFGCERVIDVPTVSSIVWDYVSRWNPILAGTLSSFTAINDGTAHSKNRRAAAQEQLPEMTAPIQCGDSVGPWRVVSVTPHQCVRFSFGQDTPGTIDLVLRVIEDSTSSTTTRVTASLHYEAPGSTGLVYWATHGFAYRQELADFTGKLGRALQTPYRIALPPDRLDLDQERTVDITDQRKFSSAVTSESPERSDRSGEESP